MSLSFFHGGGPLLLQQLKDLPDGETLLNGNRHLYPAGGARPPSCSKWPGSPCPCPPSSCPGQSCRFPRQGGEEAEEALIFDDIIVLQLVHHTAKVILVVHHDGGGDLCLCSAPACRWPETSPPPSQNNGNRADHHNIEHGVGQRGPLIPPSPLGRGSSFRLFRASSSGISFHMLPPQGGAMGQPPRFLCLFSGCSHGPDLALLGENKAHPGVQGSRAG